MWEILSDRRTTARNASFLVMTAVVVALAGKSLAEVEVVESNELPISCEKYLRLDKGASLDLDEEEVRAEAAWISQQFPSLKVRVVMVGMPVFAGGAYDVAGYPTPDGKALKGRSIAGALGPGGTEAYVFGGGKRLEAVVVAHELGHAFWHRFAQPEDRAWYVRLRGLQHSQDAFVSECFAEDFRLSFGSRKAKQPAHRYLGTNVPAEFAKRFGPANPPSRIRCIPEPSGGFSVTVEQRRVIFPDAPPWREGGIVWVPIRPVAEALGWDVQYHRPTASVLLCRDGENIEMKLDTGLVLVDSRAVDAKSVLKADRLSMPIGDVARLIDKAPEQ